MQVDDAWSTNSVELSPMSYQFPDYQPRRGEAYDEWDANWLIIRGRISTPEVTWSFLDPCMTVADAGELRNWLRHVADGYVYPSADAERPDLCFTEPNVSVRLAGREGGVLTLIWSFSQESSPPGASDEIRFGFGHPVQTAVSAQDLTSAVEELSKELERFPNRTGP